MILHNKFDKVETIIISDCRSAVWSIARSYAGTQCTVCVHSLRTEVKTINVVPAGCLTGKVRLWIIFLVLIARDISSSRARQRLAVRQLSFRDAQQPQPTASPSLTERKCTPRPSVYINNCTAASEILFLMSRNFVFKLRFTCPY